MPDRYDRDRDKVDNNTRGRIFENGAHRYFRDYEIGYLQQSRIYKTIEGKTRFDHIREDRGQTFSIEDKSGRIGGPKDDKQLKVVREILKNDPKHHHMLRSVEGEHISKEAQELIAGLKRDFPDRFTHKHISRQEAHEIWAIGRELEREQGQQIELPGVRDRARDGKAQALQRRRDKIAALAKARVRAEKNRAIQLFREATARGREEAPRLVQAERARQAEQRARRAQAREQAQARVVERPPQVPAETKALERDPTEQTRTRDDAREPGNPVPAKERAAIPAPPDQAREHEAQAREMVNNLGLGLTAEQSGQLRAILREGRERLTEIREPQRDIPARDVVPTVEPATPTREQQSMTEIERAHAKLPPELQRTIELARGPLPINPVPGPTPAEAEADRRRHATRERQRTAREQQRGRERGD